MEKIRLSISVYEMSNFKLLILVQVAQNTFTKLKKIILRNYFLCFF